MGASSKFSFFYRGFFPKSYWKDGIIGGEIVTIQDELSTWISAFLDLLFVLVFSKLQHILDACVLTEHSVFYVYCIMQIFFQGRYLLDEYTIRFYRDDIFHRISFFFYIVGVMVMIQNMDMQLTGTAVSRKLASAGSTLAKYDCVIDKYYYQQFADGFYISKSFFLFLYCVLFYADKSGKARQQFQYRVVCTTVQITLSALSSLMNDNGKLCVLFLMGELDTVVDYFLSALKTYFNLEIAPNFFPVSYSHTQERLGFYLLIVLGESLINLLVSSTDKDSPESNYIRNSAGLLLIFAYAMQYFDQVQKVEGELHAFKRHQVAGVIYVIFHKFLGFFLLFTAFGISQTSEEGKANLCKGCGLTSLFMIVTRILHKGIYYRFRKVSRIFHLALHFSISITHFLLVFTTLSHNNTLIVHAVLAMMVVVIDIVMNLVKSKDAIISHHKTVELRRNSALENFKENHMLEFIGIREEDLPIPVLQTEYEDGAEEEEILHGKDVFKEILTEGVKNIRRRMSNNNISMRRVEEGKSSNKSPLASTFSLANLFTRMSSGDDNNSSSTVEAAVDRSETDTHNVKNVLLEPKQNRTHLSNTRQISSPTFPNTKIPFQNTIPQKKEDGISSVATNSETSSSDKIIDLAGIYDKNSNAVDVAMRRRQST